jgi:hypothetical protein
VTWLVAFATALVVGGTAHADDPERAREYFERADLAINAGRLAEARDLLVESLDFARRPETAFNLSAVERAMGRTRSAVERLDELLEGDYGALDADRRAQVQALRDEVRRELATIALTVRGASAEVRVDGELVRRVARDGSVRHAVDAGRHVVTALTADGRNEERSLSIARGEVRPLELVFAIEEESDDDGTVFESPWFWIVTSVIVVGAATATIALFALDGADPCDDADPTWGCALTR